MLYKHILIIYTLIQKFTPVLYTLPSMFYVICSLSDVRKIHNIKSKKKRRKRREKWKKVEGEMQKEKEREEEMLQNEE